MESALQVLNEHWGYRQFRPAQLPIVEAMLSGRDLLAVLPTGGGKSITFQVPALLDRGTTLVLTPLVALMEDQVQRLRGLGIAAACLHGQQDPLDRRRVLASLDAGRLKLLYLSPETLLSPPLWDRLARLPIARFVLDEAHCLLGWGSSFRPEYHRLGAARLALGAPPLCAFTATAPPAAQDALIRLLGLDTPVRLVQPPYRPNLRLAVRTVWSEGQRRLIVERFLARQGEGAGLIYLRTRAATEQWATRLALRGYRIAAYHAGLSVERRRRCEADWLSGTLQCLACTNAFGMGIDAPHVRWVVHANLPPTLEEYLQEIGRAGRDGAPSEVLLVASEPSGLIEPGDRRLHQHFRAQRQEQLDQALRLLRGGGRGTWRAEDGLSLAILHERGQLVWDGPFHYRLLAAQPPHPCLDTAPLIRGYLRTSDCRWRYLLAAFGAPDAPACGHCDRCLARRPTARTMIPRTQ